VKNVYRCDIYGVNKPGLLQPEYDVPYEIFSYKGLDHAGRAFLNWIREQPGKMILSGEVRFELGGYYSK